MTIKIVPSLIPRPHLLTAKTNLVNRVKFLGLAYPQTFCDIPTQKVWDTQEEMN